MPQDWPIYAKSDRWPESAERVFLPEAVDVLGDVLWGNDDADLENVRTALMANERPDDEQGVLPDLARFMCRLFVDGALTTYARPVDGEGVRPLRSNQWERHDAANAVATGSLRLADAAGVERDHWIFLDRDEFELLLLINAPAGADPTNRYRNMELRHGRMVDLLMANIPVIAASGRAIGHRRADGSRARARDGADPSREELDAMFADAPRVLEARHQLALEERVAAWLLARFDGDRFQEVRRDTYRIRALEVFAPYLSVDLFKAAWREAVKDVPGRTKGGRPPKRPDPVATVVEDAGAGRSQDTGPAPAVGLVRERGTDPDAG